MNYYEHHLGDYMRDTAHLSMIEDCVYRRLLDAYYAREAPLPKEILQITRLARAKGAAEHRAVKHVLSEFFELHDDGYHQARCDAEISKFHEKKRKASASANARWRGCERNANALQKDMRTQSEGNAHHTPNTNIPSSNVIPSVEGIPSASPSARSVVVDIAILLNEQGKRITPQNPDLLAAVAEGVTLGDIAGFCEQYPHKPAGYVIAAARSQRAESARQISGGSKNAEVPPRRLSAAERVAAINEAAERRERERIATAAGEPIEGECHAVDAA